MKGFILFVGASLLFHASISMSQFVHHLKAEDIHLSYPLDIVIEIIIGVCLCTLSVSLFIGQLKPILLSSVYSKKKWDSFYDKENTAIFNNRSQIISKIS